MQVSNCLPLKYQDDVSPTIYIRLCLGPTAFISLPSLPFSFAVCTVFLLLFLFLLLYEVSLFIFLSFIYINKVPGPIFFCCTHCFIQYLFSICVTPHHLDSR
jgi:hypothetical protein